MTWFKKAAHFLNVPRNVGLYLNDEVNKVSPFEEKRVKSTVVTNVTGNVSYLPCNALPMGPKLISCHFLAMVKRGIFLNNHVVFTENKADLFFDQKNAIFDISMRTSEVHLRPSYAPSCRHLQIKS